MRITINKRELILIGLGSVFIIVGIICLITVPIIVMKIINKKLQLEPNTETQKQWRDIQTPIYQKYYFFNVTNGADIERLGAKPVVTEMGPYTYRTKWRKTQLVYHNNGTVSYREKKVYYFVRQMSIGNESDIVTSLNGPLAVTLSLLQNAPAAVRVVVGLALDAVTEGFFIRRSVRQLLYDGYPDLLTTFGPMLNPKIPSTNAGRFGWLINRNGSDDGEYTVFTGRDSIDRLNIIDRFKGLRELDYYRNNSECNSFADSTNGQLYPPIGDQSKELFLFSPDFCRRIRLHYQRELDKYGITVYRYTPDSTTFLNADDHPPNSCYISRLPATSNPSLFGIGRTQTDYAKKQRKLRFLSGVFDMSGCKYGAPVIMSYPHFLDAHPLYTRSIDGLKPDPKKHKFFVDVEPTTGASLGGSVRVQINIFINKPPGMFRYRNVPDIVFPVFWQELSSNITTDLTDRLKFALKMPGLMTTISSASMLTIGFIAILVAVMFPLYKHYVKHSQTKESGSVVYTDKSTANSQVDINKIITEPNGKTVLTETNGIDNKGLDAS
ncbi:scavenger receptor class B member 1-like [Oppia nitens]|uniref:scavenger receptor class B member 1-like n=1 Tax=Oppia nitens TaxID=1686743 RepID=UPI0023DC854E|nr:scavenger receptor class B member 1-like [Oppia nitens]